MSRARLESEWRTLGYRGCPDFRRAVREYEDFLAILSEHAEVALCAEDLSLSIDSIYVRDASILSNQGMVMCNMGKPERAAEPAALMKEFATTSVPVVGVIRSPGLLEGGDAAWLNEYTLAVGRGYRTNSQGLEQLKRWLEPSGCDVIVVDLPHLERAR